MCTVNKILTLVHDNVLKTWSRVDPAQIKLLGSFQIYQEIECKINDTTDSIRARDFICNYIKEL
jgi:hypothetical protein